jgi:glycosidase
MWQLTVYDKDYTTPDWLDGGIIYQIFPDRFYNSGKEKIGVPQDRFIVTDWDKQPEYTQQGNFKCLGNDYYGGDLLGIEQKLPYLKELGVNCIYLNPIFEAHSNHRYNTADYMKIDPSLGDEKDLENLVKAAKELDIHIVLDGVFSHTGDDSIYFNKNNRYDTLGAYHSKESPYRNWYKFNSSQLGYDAWWGISTLPEVDENNPEFTEYITGENGVIRYWLNKGIKGFRLDVADELTDEILDNIRKAIKADSQENFLLGEVWEDATNKVSYDCRRRFLRGKQLDSVMNYPFSKAIISYLQGSNAQGLLDTVLTILENYPPQSVKVLMNHVGTHDTPRILTLLGKGEPPTNDRDYLSKQSLTAEEYEKAVKLLKVGAVIQYGLPGVPSLYYGDEVGMQGYGDPFCRGSYPWGKEDKDLLEFYKQLGAIRRQNDVFASGDFVPVHANFGEFVFIRKKGDTQILIAASRWCDATTITIPPEFANAECLFGEKQNGTTLTLSPHGYSILKITK